MAYFSYITFVSVVSFNDVTIPAVCFCLSLKLYLNSLVYHRNIFGSSSKVFGNLRTSSEILGKCSETFVWPSEQSWKIFGNLRKVVGNLRKIIKNALISMARRCVSLAVVFDFSPFFIFQVWLIRSLLRSNVQSSRIFVHGFAVYLVCNLISMSIE